MSQTKTGKVRASGGVVVRTADSGDVEVLLVHRPAYRDWTFPKGKAEPGERWRDTARREVREETGFDCRLERKLGTIRYRDGKGRAKKVKYWMMSVVAGSFVPNDEVDAVRWCAPDEARRVLTYDRDRVLLDSITVSLPA